MTYIDSSGLETLLMASRRSASPVRLVADALKIEIEDAHEATIGGYP